MDRDDHIRGSLLGVAWGDAYGCPVEGWRESQIRSIYGTFDELPVEYPLDKIATELGPKAVGRLRPLGLHSDDTQQAVALLNVCLDGWTLDTWAALLVEGMAAGAWRGYGRNFAHAVGQLSRGTRPQESGSSSAGIGAAMRIAPLGALYADRPDLLSEVVMESSLSTHGNIVAGAIAYAIAWVAGAFVLEKPTEEIFTQLPDSVASVEAQWLTSRSDWRIDRSSESLASMTLCDLLESLPGDLGQLRQRISNLARPHLAPGFTKAHPNQGFALLGGVHALAMSLLPDTEPANVLSDIVSMGYDTDTVAAIAGGLLGARFGTSWIPLGRMIDAPRLQAYADAMVERSSPPEDRQQFLQRERELTLQEQEFQVVIAASE